MVRVRCDIAEYFSIYPSTRQVPFKLLFPYRGMALLQLLQRLFKIAIYILARSGKLGWRILLFISQLWFQFLIFFNLKFHEHYDAESSDIFHFSLKITFCFLLMREDKLIEFRFLIPAT